MNLLFPKMLHLVRKILGVLFVMTTMLSLFGYSKCEFEAIFNFGDSNTDTGGLAAAFPSPTPGPNGITYFKRPSGRACDGRVITDFLAQAIGMPFLSPYLQSIGSDYRHGANYATSSSTVLLPNTSLFVTGTSPFALPVQLNQMREFKARVDEYNSSKKEGSMKLPFSDIFNKSLYTIYIGQNDFTSNLATIGIEGVKQYLPQVVSQIASTIQELYSFGARTFMVLNLAPIGCYPAYLVTLPHESSDIDMYGCMISYNNAVNDYNKLLNETMSQTRELLPDTSLIYVDTNSFLLELYQHPTSHGLEYGTRACCGYGGGNYNYDPQVFCGVSKEVDGKNVTAEPCKHPEKYVSWDGIHATDAANKLTVRAILGGSYFYPPFPLNQHCDIQPIGLLVDI